MPDNRFLKLTLFNHPQSNKSLKKLEVYDPAMCCSTGVCGPQVDPALVRFAADLKWLQEQGVEVRRFNLSQDPGAYVENGTVKAALAATGEAVLPLMLADGKVASTGRYPERNELAKFAGLSAKSPAPAPAKTGGCCCGGNC